MLGHSLRPLAHLAVTIALTAVTTARASDDPSAASRHLAVADSLFAAADLQGARHAYAAVLEADPNQSRALYQLARLTPPRHDAERLLRQYVALEPEDAWGYLALGDLLASHGEHGEALAQYDAGLRLAPGEREFAVGRARALAGAGHTDDAIAAYEAWLAGHAADAEAWDELGRERRKAGRLPAAAAAFARAVEAGDARASARQAAARRAAAPAVEPFVASSWDSDGNELFRQGLGLDFSTPAGRLGVRGSRLTIQDAVLVKYLDELVLATTWRPRATMHLQIAPGVVRLPAEMHGGSDEWIPTLQARAAWRAASVPAALEVRAARELLTSSPLLVESMAVRSEGLMRTQLPLVAGLQLRGAGRYARLESRWDTNARRAFQGGLALAVTPGLEFSLQVVDQRYDHPSAAGYFAPRCAQLAELGAYLEMESLGPLSLAIDLGGGVQRVTAFGSAAGAWEPALRVWVQLGLEIGGGCRLNLECEGNDSEAGVATTSASAWRYGFLAASLRLPLP